MLTITNTPNSTGVKISGDYFDLDGLNQAIYQIIGDEEKYYDYAGARMRILGISFEIRHAAQGDRNIEKVFNGLHDHVKKQHGFIAPDKNIYFSVEILWPEILFTALALKDYVRLHRKESKNPEWDIHLHTVSHFQALVLDCLHGQVQEEEFQTILKAFSNTLPVEDYAIQYIDFLNLKYIGMTKAQREKTLPIVAVKIAMQDQDYLSFRQEVLAAANPAKKSIHEISIQAEYPETIMW
ncbi:DUF6904 family protein [Planococcus shixiaomingii]|uniref:DUF6904 family protein n=1 Tax=Planococcus shixiaomingii TaxID=3058393 RepID=UPI00262F0EEC|nr:hypothetical protein [Planococcus sp. N022]WKA54327.1 hypothetical protein QWY21_16895 [Planococcus sp. N022]